MKAASWAAVKAAKMDATKEDTTFERLGTIRTKSALVASEGGDKQLYFKHAGAR